MSKWDYMDDKVWSSSEVIKEFEKIYFKKNAEDISKKIEDTKKLINVTKELGKTADETNKILGKADDSLSEDKPKDMEKEDIKEEIKEDKLDDKEYKTAKAKLIKELSLMAIAAADSGNYKLAYKIERAIDSVDFED